MIILTLYYCTRIKTIDIDIGVGKEKRIIVNIPCTICLRRDIEESLNSLHSKIYAAGEDRDEADKPCRIQRTFASIYKF